MSGPFPVVLNGVAVTQAEGIIATLPPSSWQDALGMTIALNGVFAAPATAGTLNLRIRQGSLITGVPLALVFAINAAISTNVGVSAGWFDASAFGQQAPVAGAGQPGPGQYVLTASYAAAAGGSISGLLLFETANPLA